MIFNEWRERYKRRNDVTSRVTHLTNGNSDNDAFENLLSILNDKKIKGGLGYINGNIPVICMQEVPLHSLAENLLYEIDLRKTSKSEKSRYREFGLRFSKVFIYKNGGRPVIYENAKEMKKIIPHSEHWRLVDMQLSKLDNLIDWSHEREWRVKDELCFEYTDTEIIVPSNKYYRKFISYCDDNNKIDILKGINGIITLNSANY